MTGDAQRAKFENAELTLDGNPGMGVLDVSITGKVPALPGRWLSTARLSSLLSAFTPLTAAGEGRAGQADAGFADRIELDLRLSAASAPRVRST